MATQIKLRRDSSANWESVDPVLAEGEPGYDLTNKKLKIGDGSTAWSLLDWFDDQQNATDALSNGAYSATLDANGNLAYPGDVTQSNQDNTTCSAGVDTVIYTGTNSNQHAIKLFVMVEGTPDGGTSWETQACDIIAVRGFVNDIVHVTAYGITYSSASAFAEFDGQWNSTTNRIEITCRPTSLTNNVVASVHAIEMTSND